MLTQEDENALTEFLETTGALNGLDPMQSRAVCVDLVWKVSLIVTGAVDQNMDELAGHETQLSCS